MTPPGSEETWVSALAEALQHGHFQKLVLSRPRNTPDTPDAPQQIRVRPIQLKGKQTLTFVTRFATRDETRNLTHEAGLREIAGLLNTPFRSAHLFLDTGTLQLDFSKKGRPMLRRTAATAPAPAPAAEHDRAKQYLTAPSAPWLQPLGVTDAAQQVLPSMSRKWKQINKFAEILQKPLETLPDTGQPVHVVDFGCGRGLLTFALYDQLRKQIGDRARVTGVELREHLVTEANHTARAIQYDGLAFAAGDIQHFISETPINGIIALHACDTATDLAIFAGIQANADFIICAPCCHKEIRPQITPPPVLEPVLRFGIQLGQEADMITDSLRVLLLESQGYETKLFEFISLEHTAKNKMILAVRGKNIPAKKAEALQKINELKAFYGISSQCLENLLNHD
ncbi:MAG: SAM-dependent methyltransferase [Verrucomicrobia bacterium]|nr:SAM-dependent methyltransferase [Verrucomicrobiota bacterium]MCH8526565.1 SAM-dependent methyltransferase [Kiritimatiellia bacterium]